MHAPAHRPFVLRSLPARLRAPSTLHLPRGLETPSCPARPPPLPASNPVSPSAGPVCSWHSQHAPLQRPRPIVRPVLAIQPSTQANTDTHPERPHRTTRAARRPSLETGTSDERTTLGSTRDPRLWLILPPRGTADATSSSSGSTARRLFRSLCCVANLHWCRFARPSALPARSSQVLLAFQRRARCAAAAAAAVPSRDRDRPWLSICFVRGPSAVFLPRPAARQGPAPPFSLGLPNKRREDRTPVLPPSGPAGRNSDYPARPPHATHLIESPACRDARPSRDLVWEREISRRRRSRTATAALLLQARPPSPRHPHTRVRTHAHTHARSRALPQLPRPQSPAIIN